MNDAKKRFLRYSDNNTRFYSESWKCANFKTTTEFYIIPKRRLCGNDLNVDV